MTDKPPCPRCGIVHERCRGHNRKGEACGRHPCPDQEVCKLHGGASPAARQSAARRAVERRAANELRRRWADGSEAPVADPLTELARIAGETVAFKDYLRDQVTALEGVLTYWTERTTFDPVEAKIRTTATEDLRATVTAYERSLDRSARILASIVKLDLAGRMLELNQEKATLIADAVRYGLGQVDMAAELRHAAQAAIADALAGLSARPQPPKELAS